MLAFGKLAAANAVDAAAYCVLSVDYMMVDYVTNYCSPKNGTFGTLQMLLNQDVDVIFGPMCSRGKIFRQLWK